ncbi:hypothetical protein BIY29_14095 [Brenneria alni]|uniref:Uncharacterized protein n=2 Tax=Brenneria alni TaxID=71656 RepID=A0A421DLN2_9GAMM|nr:hypothetical protein BIY29_14095 [Brenneria alni]
MFIFPGVIYMLFNISHPTDKIIIASFFSVLFFISLVVFITALILALLFMQSFHGGAGDDCYVISFCYDSDGG